MCNNTRPVCSTASLCKHRGHLPTSFHFSNLPYKNVKCVSVPKHKTKKKKKNVYGHRYIELHVLCILEMEKTKLWPFTSGNKPRYECIGDWVGLRASLDAVEWANFLPSSMKLSLGPSYTVSGQYAVLQKLTSQNVTLVAAIKNDCCCRDSYS
jgi:hypothetical protein